MSGGPTTLLARLVYCVRDLPVWLIVAGCVLLLGLPFVIAFLQGSLPTLVQNGEWRLLLLEPVVVIYVFVVAPIVFTAQHEVIEAMRSIARLDHDDFDQLVASASRINPGAEGLAILAGAAFALLLYGPAQLLMEPSALRVYTMIESMVMFGLMGWVIFSALMGNQFMAAVHRQPLNVNIFDIRPFEPIGRQSLVICLVFIGGTVISLVFAYSPGNFFTWRNLVIYGTLATVTILLFFVNMWRTHLVLHQAKQDALGVAQRHLGHAYRTLDELTVQRAELQSIAAEVNAWNAMEQRLKVARTWPYNTEMLRTLFLSALVPLILALVRQVGALLMR